MDLDADTFAGVVILFDLDGTLTDPFDGITKSAAYALDAMGLPPLDPAQQRALIGPPLQDSFAALGLDAVGAARAVDLYRERYRDEGLYEQALYDGIPEVLAELAGQRVRMALATLKPTAFAVRVIEHLGLQNFFAVIGGATLDGTRRHKADIITVTLAELGMPGSVAVMVGDRAQDVHGTRAAGAASVGVRWGYAEPGELEAAGAGVIVDTPADLVPALGESSRSVAGRVGPTP